MTEDTFRSVRAPPRDPSIWSAMALTVGLFALVAFITFPAATAAVSVALGLGWYLVRHGLPTIAARLRGRTHELTVPGLGTLEYRLTDR